MQNDLVKNIKKNRTNNRAKRIFLLSLLIILTGLFFSTTVMADGVSFGGEVKAVLSGTYSEANGLQNDLSESLDLEMFIPSVNDTDIKVQFLVYNPEKKLLDGSRKRIDFKKLYLKHKFDKYYLTVGRQPVSWSFGSMLNPVDFSLGAVSMDQETMGKYQDAVKVYYPVNWNSSLELVAADTGMSNDYKWGVRGRTGYEGFDLTLNYVKEPVAGGSLLSILPIPLPSNNGNIINDDLTMERVGFTAKGDIGSIGAYTSLGYYKVAENQPSYSYLLGGDYSFTYNYFKKITMQMEYLGLKDELLVKTIGNAMNIDDIGSTLDLFMGSINYPIDDFSSIRLIAIKSLDDGSTIIMPVYENQLPGNIKLTLSSSIFTSENKMLSGQGMKAGYELALSYTF